ncbi:hypothetical protein K503DRAFT_550213 [Rhizopogon vinicolor AM-OR11-026]|uniref:Uncharacterized protein n=1 Tax=Rhizopogon vinicolor AM-OR11-026 TaxID=1314800 RepID=A0A1B7MKM4_9AGAM|nr:hypothetical protein K503DRAFT_550213 [Rhizopogon vinicolor AM-OR11-026]
MTEDSPHRKMGFRWIKHSHLNSRLSQDAAARATSGNEMSSLHAPPRRSNLSFGKLWGKVSKKGSTRSTQSSNSAESSHPVISPSGQDLSSARTDETLSPLITPTPKANSDQVPNLPAANAGVTDPKLVTKSLENAHKGLSGASHVPDLLRNTASATANAGSVLDPIDTFSDMLTPLKAFNSIANSIAEV